MFVNKPAVTLARRNTVFTVKHSPFNAVKREVEMILMMGLLLLLVEGKLPMI